jgi:hypothetical protein
MKTLPQLNWTPRLEDVWGSEGIAPCILNFCTRRRWVVSSTSRPHYPPGKEPPLLPIEYEAGRTPDPVWTQWQREKYLYPCRQPNPGQYLKLTAYSAHILPDLSFTLVQRTSFEVTVQFQYFIQGHKIDQVRNKELVMTCSFLHGGSLVGSVTVRNSSSRAALTRNKKKKKTCRIRK